MDGSEGRQRRGTQEILILRIIDSGEKKLVTGLESVGDILQEDETEDDMLVLRGVHVVSERICHAPQLRFIDTKERAICQDTKTGNAEWLPVVAPLVKLLSDGWVQINLRRAEYEIRKKIKGTNLAWKGWYAFRRGLATNLYRCGMRPEQACLILRNSAEVVRRHYIRLEQEGTKVDAMARLEQAYEQCAASVQ